MKGKEKSDRLIEVTTWAGLTVFDDVLTTLLSMFAGYHKVLSTILWIIFCPLVLILFILSVIRFTASTYPFGIFNLRVHIMYTFCYCIVCP